MTIPGETRTFPSDDLHPAATCLIRLGVLDWPDAGQHEGLRHRGLRPRNPDRRKDSQRKCGFQAAGSGFQPDRTPRLIQEKRHTNMGHRIKNPRAVGGSTRSTAEVLLVHDVASLGRRGDIVKVRPGYARNYLLPHGLATIATEQNRRMAARHREKLEQIEAARIRDLRKLADAVSRYSATIEANAMEDNTLYGSVTARDISDALKAGGHNVEPEQVQMDGAIKELGMYTVKLSFHEKVSAEVKVWVVPSAASA